MTSLKISTALHSLSTVEDIAATKEEWCKENEPTLYDQCLVNGTFSEVLFDFLATPLTKDIFHYDNAGDFSNGKDIEE